jgi:hypothetical protein
MLLKLCNILHAVHLRGSPNNLNEITLSLVSNSSKMQYSNRERISLLIYTPIADCGGEETDQAGVCLGFAN